MSRWTTRSTQDRSPSSRSKLPQPGLSVAANASSYREVPGFSARLASASPVWAAQGHALTAVISREAPAPIYGLFVFHQLTFEWCRRRRRRRRCRARGCWSGMVSLQAHQPPPSHLADSDHIISAVPDLPQPSAARCNLSNHSPNPNRQASREISRAADGGCPSSHWPITHAA